MVGMKKCWRFFPYWADCKYYLWRDLMPQPVWQCTKCFPDQWSGSLFIFLWCYWEKRKKYMATTFLTDWNKYCFLTAFMWKVQNRISKLCSYVSHCYLTFRYFDILKNLMWMYYRLCLYFVCWTVITNSIIQF